MNNKPGSIRSAICLMCVLFLLYVLRVFYVLPNLPEPIDLTYFVMVGFELLIVALLTGVLLLKRQWARWTCAIVLAAGVVSSIPGIGSLFQRNSALGALGSVELLVQVFVVVLLMLPSSSEWYSNAKAENYASDKNA